MFADPKLFPDEQAPRACEKHYRGRPLEVQTLFGPVHLRRSYYHHVPSGTGRYPMDQALGVVRGCSPAVARLICRASSQSSSYAEASADLQAYSGLQIQTRIFDRMVAQVSPTLRQARALLPPLHLKDIMPILYASWDGTGTPMRKDQLEGCLGRQPDGSACTREAKLGSIFTQSSCDENGEPLRDPDSTTYVGTFEGCRSVAILLREEALRRGLGRAQQVVCLGDGAAWVWENARTTFPGAVQILDFFHAAEHVGNLADGLFGKGTSEAKAHQDKWVSNMKRTNPAAMLEEARAILPSLPLTPVEIELVEGEIAYFENQGQRTEYGKFRAAGYFIGSGVIEAGCKTVIGRRLKQSGMFWSQRGAEDLLSLRCLVLDPRFDEAWNAMPQILEQQARKARRWTSQN